MDLREVRRFPVEDGCFGVSVCPKERVLVTLGGDPIVWDLEAGVERGRFEGHPAGVHCAIILTDGRRCVSAGDDLTPRVWDLATGDTIESLPWGEGGVPFSFALSRDGRFLAAGKGIDTVTVWNLEDPEQVWDFGYDGHHSEGAIQYGHQGMVESVCFTPDAREVLGGYVDGAVRAWNWSTGAFRTVSEHDGDVLAVAVDPQGEKVAAGGADHEVRVVALADGRELWRRPGHAECVTVAAFTPDGRRLVTADGRGELRIWDAERGTPLCVQRIHEDSVSSLVLLSGGRRVVTGSRDGSARLWEIASH